MGRRSRSKGRGNDVIVDVILRDRNFQAKMKMMAKSALRTAAATDKLERSTKKTGDTMFDTSKRSTFLGRVFKRLATNIIAVAAAAIGIQRAVRVFRQMTEETRKFSKQMGQVATITKLNTSAFKTLNQQVISLSRSLPKTADDLALGLYQAISAGITDVSEAFEVMRTSAVLASAGMVETGDAVKLVTTVLNAYNLPASEAEHITDVFFETVRRGVTTVPELAANFGTLATSAALVGITMEEASAAFATMTRQGINSARAATSLNRFFIALAKVTPEVRKEAVRLGIDFSKMGVALAGGLLPWMEKLQEVTGGNIESLAKLSPNIRAALSTFVLAGNGAEGFARDMEGLADTAGSTAAAMDKVRLTIDERFVQVAARFKAELIEIGQVILPGIVSAMEDMTAGLEDDLTTLVRTLREQGLSEERIVEIQGLARMEELTFEINEAVDAFENLGESLADIPSVSGLLRTGFRAVTRAMFVGAGDKQDIAQVIRDAISSADGEAEDFFPVLLETLKAELEQVTNDLADIAVERIPEGALRDFGDLGTLDLAQVAFNIQTEKLEEAIAVIRTLIDAPIEIGDIRAALDAGPVVDRVLTAADLRAMTLADEMERIRKDMEIETKRIIDELNRQIANLGQVPISFIDLDAEKAKLQELADELGRLMGQDGAFAGTLAEQLALGPMMAADETGDLESLVGRYNALNEALLSFNDALAENEAAQRDTIQRGGELIPNLARQETAMGKLIKAAIKLSGAMADANGKAEDMGNLWRDLATMANGITRIADAFGILDDNLRKVLDGAGSLFESLEALSELEPGEGFGDLKLGEQLQFAGGAASIAAGVIGGIASLFSGESAAEAAQRQIDAMRQLRDSLDSLRDAVQKGAGVSAAELARANAAADLVNEARAEARRDFRSGGKARVGLQQRIAARTPEGEALRAAILDLEKTLAIDLSALFGGTGDEMRAAFDLLIANLDVLNDGFGAFNDQFSGQMALFQLTVDQFDITDTTKQMEKFFDLIVNEFSPGLARAIAGFDLSTFEGRAALDQFIADLALSIARGEETGLFDPNLTNEEILALLSSIDGFLDLLQSDAGDDGQSFSRNVQITEARAGRLLAMTATLVTRAEHLTDLAILRNAALDGILAAMAVTATAGAALPTATAGAPAPASSTVTLGPINVNVGIDVGAGAEAVGEEVGQAVLESIDQALRERGVNSSRVIGAV